MRADRSFQRIVSTIDDFTSHVESSFSKYSSRDFIFGLESSFVCFECPLQEVWSLSMPRIVLQVDLKPHGWFRVMSMTEYSCI
jgi:hypothetical protein